MVLFFLNVRLVYSLLLITLAMTIFVPVMNNVFADPITGIVFEDENGDGEMNNADYGLQNISVIINNTSSFQDSTLTNAAGFYSLDHDPLFGDHLIKVTPPSGKIFTTPSMISLPTSSGAHSQVIEFGLRDVYPLPNDMTMPTSSWLYDVGNGIEIPAQTSSLDLIITKNPTCTLSSDTVDGIDLRFFAPGTGTDGSPTLIVPMQYDGNIWSATIPAPFDQGMATFEAHVYCSSLGTTQPDTIQRGDLIFVDPSGTVIDGCIDLPAENVKVTLYKRDIVSGMYEIPITSDHIPTTNPMFTDENGDYGWMTVAGDYMVKVSKSGYNSAEIDSLIVPPPRFGVDFTLEPNTARTCIDEMEVIDKIPPTPTIWNPSTSLTMSSNPSTLKIGGDIVFTFYETNDGTVPLTDVELISFDSNCDPRYLSGDNNNDEIIDPGETWIYQCVIENIQTTSVTTLVIGTAVAPNGDVITWPGDQEEIVYQTLTASGAEGGCLIATATYGTELAPQVQFLREIRDTTLLSTESGTSFMESFNTLYYSFAPTVSDWERENPLFKETVKLYITPMLSTLSIMSLANEGSEIEVLGLGLSVIVLNLGMYFVAPAIVVMQIRKRI